MVLRYTLQRQFQQAARQVHTDAWLEHSSTAGQRALQVGDDPKWVVIASSGLQRGAANVGAGGMMKKNLPVRSLAPTMCCNVTLRTVGQMFMSGPTTFYKKSDRVNELGLS